MNKKVVELGTFEVVSDKLRISDPCYDKDTWCAGTVDNVLPGTWKAQVVTKTETEQFHRCWKLCAVHESFDKSKITIKKLKIDVGVDSGQAGIFDDKFYQQDYNEDYIMYGNKEYNDNSRKHSRKSHEAMREVMAHIHKVPYTKLTDEEYAVDDIKISLMVLRNELARLPKSIEENANRKGFEEFAIRDARRLEEMKARLARYEADPRPENLIERTRDWYEICSDKTLSNTRAGVIRNGVVSSSGFGDGSYTAYAAYNPDGKVVGVKILF